MKLHHFGIHHVSSFLFQYVCCCKNILQTVENKLSEVRHACKEVFSHEKTSIQRTQTQGFFIVKVKINKFYDPCFVITNNFSGLLPWQTIMFSGNSQKYFSYEKSL